MREEDRKNLDMDRMSHTESGCVDPSCFSYNPEGIDRAYFHSGG